MAAQQIVDRLILDNQNLVIDKLMKYDDTLRDELGQLRSDKGNQRIRHEITGKYQTKGTVETRIG